MTSLEQFHQDEIEDDIKYSGQIASAYLNEALRYENIDHEQYQQKLFVAATKYRRASAQCILLEDFGSANKSLLQAAKCYNMAGSSYALLMFALANNFEESNRHLVNYVEIPERPVPVNMQVQAIYTLVYWAFEQRVKPVIDSNYNKSDIYSELLSMYDNMSALKGTSVGVLGIDIMFYLDVVDYFYPHFNHGQKLTLGQILRPFLCLYDHALRLAQSIKHNWVNLNMPFHPTELDVLAILHLLRKYDLSEFNGELDSAPITSESKDNLFIFLNGLS